ncbi:MAG: pyridoxamine 5'-phosphate oxidase family protein [Promethearchaeia archaeon]
MPIKLPQMSDQEIKNLIETQSICRMAFIDTQSNQSEVYPYIAPFQYIYNDAFYFHFTDYGKKKRILEKNNNVCISIEQLKEELSEFYFISIQGTLVEVKDDETKKAVIRALVEDARNSFSENFLSAHGFEKEEGWEAFKPDGNLRIFKLKETGERVALKSG